MRPLFESASLKHLYTTGEFASLAAMCEEIVRDSQTRYGPAAIEVAYALADLGRAHYESGNYSAAASSLNEAISIQAELGNYTEEYAKDLSNLGRLHVLLGQFIQAESLLDRAMRVLNALPANEQMGYSSILMNRAFLHAARNEIKVAEQLLLKAAKHRLQEYGACHPKYGDVFSELAGLYWKAGRCQASQRALAKAVRIYRCASHTECAEYAKMLANLGRVKAHGGNLGEARNYSIEALSVLQRVCPPSHPAVVALERQLSALGISK